MSALDAFVDGLSNIGLISNQDFPVHRAPPEAFTQAMNVRFVEDRAVRVLGLTQVLGTPSVAPHFLLPVRSANETLFWVYCSLLKAFTVTGGVHSDITRAAGGDYNASAARDWNSTIHGGIPILNTGNDALQMWTPISAAQKLQALTNWPAADRCRVIRSHGPHLVALNCTIGGVTFPHGVLWSHPSDPGAVPTSWDFTSDTVDAGLYELPDASQGVILEGLLHRGQLFIYKERSTWSMRFIGGRPVFAFNNFLEQSGILATRCAGTTGDGKWQFVVASDDVFVHNGADVVPLLDNRFKKALFNLIDGTNYRNSFVFCDPKFKEMWFCYPENGQTQPTRAMIWNYGQKSNIGAISEAQVNFVAAAIGDTEVVGETWDAASFTWDTVTTPWSSSNRHQLLVARPTATKILQLDSGTTDDGAAISAILARETTGFIGRKPDGQPIIDFSLVKWVRRLWIEATGGPMSVRMGSQAVVGGAISWSTAQTFDPATQLYLDWDDALMYRPGTAISFEFTANVPFEITSYKSEIVRAGRVMGGA